MQGTTAGPLANSVARCDDLRRAISEAIGDLRVAVYLSLPIAAWSQTG
jgi:hypothetical protein